MITRRSFGWSSLAAAGTAAASAQPPARPRVACVLNVYSPNTHADVFVGRLLDGYRLNGRWHAPRLQTTAFYVDQFPFNDMAREQAAEYGIRIAASVEEAIQGVDGIAVIGEHGQYPRTARGNFMYPRKRYFDQIVAHFERRGRVVPILNDKYFAYKWEDARAMYERVHALRIPFACGSTVPLAWQRPRLELPAKASLREVLGVSYSDLEEHGYHAIEAMQAVAERRGETGVARVRFVAGDAVRKLAPDLLQAALARRVNPPPADDGVAPVAFEIEYRDGLRGVLVHWNGATRDYLVAARTAEKRIHATCFYISLYAHTHWGFLVRAFEELVLTRKPQMPPERTLIANGILLAGLESRLRGGTWIDTPELSYRYSWPG